MKYEHSERKGLTQMIPESPDETAAVSYVATHVPIFAGSEPAVVAAFLAGITHGQGDLAGRMRDLAQKWISQSRHPQRRGQATEIEMLARHAGAILEELAAGSDKHRLDGGGQH